MRGYARLDRAATRTQKNLRRFTGAVLGRALTSAEQSELSIAVYDALARTGADLGQPHPWEPAWWKTHLPPAPARVLVGACGDGREMVALRQMGYQVDGFEPARRPVRACRERLGHGSTVATATYADFVAAVTSGRPNSDDIAAIAERQYDAFVFGWGSLGHVLVGDERTALVAAADASCPNGPLLATFWLGVSLHALGRSGQLGQRVGDRIARLRGLHDADDRVSFGSWFGFNRVFTNEEIEALGAAVGRETRWGDATQYPHVAWVKAP